ncbi:MAG: pentapeptide repeat-containing protein [Anaerolineales bacterium]|nr:pentapeptide repeat-containing protein [Anaerolineales bacterium]
MKTRTTREKWFIAAFGTIVLAAYFSIAAIGNTDIYSLTRVLTGKNLGCNLQNIDLSGINKPETGLAGADLEYAVLSGANLRDSNFTGAFMRYANLSGADLQNAILRNAVLNSTNMTDVDLRGADLRGAYLVDADLTGALVTTAQLESTHTLLGATMPDGRQHK